MSRLISVMVALLVVAGLCFAEGGPKVYGKQIMLKEATSIATITADPAKYVDKDVMISGKVLRVCQGSGCWVEVMAADSSKIICKSLDESVLLPKDCAGKDIQVEGKVILDKQASGKEEMKKEPGMAEHACPAPKLMISTSGAMFASAMPAAAPAVQEAGKPASTVAPAAAEKPATAVEKSAAPATEKAAPAAEKIVEPTKDKPAPAAEKPVEPAKDKPAPTTPPTPQTPGK